MTNVELVKQAYSHFANGNVPAVLALFDPAIEWHECKGMSFVTGDGIFTGPEAIVTNVFMHLPVTFDGFNIAVNEIFGAEDKVVMTGYYQEQINQPVILLKPMPRMYGQLKTESWLIFSRQWIRLPLTVNPFKDFLPVFYFVFCDRSDPF